MKAFDGDRLVLKTEVNEPPVDGRDGVGILTFGKAQPAR